MFAVAVHGGAGNWEGSDRDAALAGVRTAAEQAIQVLYKGGDALDAVIAAVVELEDNPLFNAGTGSDLNIEGEAEMDAAVMTGRGLRCGGVGALRRVRNPVLVARKVMEETPHILLVGPGAERFARSLGFPEYDPVTPQARRVFTSGLKALRSGRGQAASRGRQHASTQSQCRTGTVGAAALDRSGILAAATSTGGTALKLAGRVGDTPIPGAGNYATACAAASATGQGELMLRSLATKALCDLVAAGHTAQQAVRATISRISQELGGHVGLIAIDRTGGVGVGHSTAAMPHAVFRDGDNRISARMRVRP